METETTYTEKQEKILAAAEHLFAEHGYEGTAIRDIAEKAGVNIAMISYYFGSKEKMLEAIFSKGASHFKNLQEELRNNSSLTALQKLEWFIDNRIEKIFSRERFFRLMICEQMIDKNIEITKMMNSLRSKSADMIKQILKDGKKDGSIAVEVDPAFLLNTITGIIIQTILSKPFYTENYKLTGQDNAAVLQHMKKKLSGQIKAIVKCYVTNV